MDFVIRLADNIHVLYEGVWRNILETALRVPPMGQVVWKGGKERAIPCWAVVFRARLREEDDPEEPNPEVNLVFPLVGAGEPLILATSLPVGRRHEVRAVVKIYEYRWAIETTFENMKSELHLDEFMVRQWVAIERMLWAAMAYILLVVLRLEAHEEGRRFLAEVLRLLRRRAVMGKLREAIALDYIAHSKGWLAALHEAT